MATIPLQPGAAPANPPTQSPSLRVAISAALRRHGIPPSRFGRMVANDPALIIDVTRHEREPRLKMELRIRNFIAKLDREASL